MANHWLHYTVSDLTGPLQTSLYTGQFWLFSMYCWWGFGILKHQYSYMMIKIKAVISEMCLGYLYVFWRWLMFVFDDCQQSSWIYSNIAIVITLYLPSCLARRQRRDFSIFESSCHLHSAHRSTTLWRLHIDTFLRSAFSREAVKINFYRVWFDPTGNRTRVYRFSNRRFIHLTTDRFNIAITLLYNRQNGAKEANNSMTTQLQIATNFRKRDL